MRLELIKEIFMLFARFPDKKGVLELFSQGESDLLLYEKWMAEVEQLPEESLFPSIKHYIFGVDVAAVAERISNINDCFMFVDYGQITSESGSIGQRSDSLAIMVTIAFPNKKGKSDLIETAAKSEMSLNMMSEFRNILYKEERCVPWLKMAMADHELQPWHSVTMPSTGWSLLLERTQADMLKMKDIR